MNDERKEYKFLWLIENYSYCWQKKGDELKSPQFIAEDLESTTWYLSLYPRGENRIEKGYVTLYLQRCQIDHGPEEFPLNFKLSVLLKDGQTLVLSSGEQTFKKGTGFGCSRFLPRDDLLVRRKAEYLPQDTLKLLCEIWKGKGNIQEVKQIAARTRIGIEHISFLRVTEKFSSLEANQKNTLQIRFPSIDDLMFTSSLYYSDDPWCEGRIMVEITPSNDEQILCRCKISLIEKSGRVIECGEADNRFDIARERQDIKRLPLSISRQVILNSKNLHLPDDKLSLQCECIFSTGLEFEKIERNQHGITILTLNQMSDHDMNNVLYGDAEKMNSCPNALDDFKKFYNKHLLADVELKTKSESFSAHKFVLCARSSVFEAMLINDMKEKRSNCIQIDDLEDDIVQKLLMFLYTDKIENLQWESATKLYYSGDKYAIGKLKVMCSSFLVNNVTAATASEILLLADTHNDLDFKKAVEDFIFKHEEVFVSDEWRNLIETNPALVSKTMCLKYTRKLVVPIYTPKCNISTPTKNRNLRGCALM